MADAVAKLAQLMSWESFGDLLTIFWENLTLPNSDNSTIIFDFIVFHATSDPLIFAIRAGLGFAFACWFQSMATGNHSWVLYKTRKDPALSLTVGKRPFLNTYP